MKTTDAFRELLKRQHLYNLRIRSDKHASREAWTQTYLMGIVSEIDEVLREMSWKLHRKQEELEPSSQNIGFELADITKYVLSLWLIWGFDADEIIDLCNKKSDLLETVWYEDRDIIEDGRLVVVTDIDGTLADWRKTFRNFLEGADLEVNGDSEVSMSMEQELGLDYREYNILKNKFESEGGYSRLVPYRDAVNFLRDAASGEHRAYVVAFTARPFHVHKRIWYDTWEWIKAQSLPIKQLRSGADSRLMYAIGLMPTHRVIVLDDNPELILRAAHSGLTVIARRHPYNEGISHENITFVNSYEEVDLKEIVDENR